jgi:mRNA interferase MazF
MTLRRGDLVTVSLKGEYGKPRPALVVQSDFYDLHPSVTILPLTGDLRDTPLFRVCIEPEESNGLKRKSQIMVDKAMTVSRNKLSKPFGKVSDENMIQITRCLAIFLGIA